MKPIKPVVPGLRTPAREVVWAENQPQYFPLPAIIVEGGNRTITRWKLTWRERLRLLIFGDLWLSVLTFGAALQPIMLETQSPKRWLDPDPTTEWDPSSAAADPPYSKKES